MGNVIDYLVQYADQAFAERAFCDVDVLILAQLSYFDFGSAVPTIAQHKKSVTLEEIDRTALHKFMEEYDYLHREKDEILQDAIKKKKLGLKQRRGVFNRIIQKLRKIIEIYNWE